VPWPLGSGLGQPVRCGPFWSLSDGFLWPVLVSSWFSSIFVVQIATGPGDGLRFVGMGAAWFRLTGSRCEKGGYCYTGQVQAVISLEKA